MDRTIDDLTEEINSLKKEIVELSTLINKIILLIHLSNTDLKNHLHVLD
jgi:2',3'-cyclic-nucleotide 2'-phosphodiesterase (5'-nucleotidase family)